MIIHCGDKFNCSIIINRTFPSERTIDFSFEGNELVFKNDDDRQDVHLEITFTKLKQICRVLNVNEKKYTLSIVVIRND